MASAWSAVVKLLSDFEWHLLTEVANVASSAADLKDSSTAKLLGYAVREGWLGRDGRTKSGPPRLRLTTLAAATLGLTQQ